MENPQEQSEVSVPEISPEEIAEIRSYLRQSQEETRARLRREFLAQHPGAPEENVAAASTGGDRESMDVDVLSDEDVALWGLLKQGALTPEMIVEHRGTSDAQGVAGRRHYFALLNNLLSVQWGRKSLGKPNWKDVK